MLLELHMPTVGEKAQKILSHLSRKYPIPGKTFDVPKGEFWPIELELLEYLAVGWCHDETELFFLLSDYLQNAEGFVEFREVPTVERLERFWRITPKGWAHLDSLRRNILRAHLHSLRCGSIHP